MTMTNVLEAWRPKFKVAALCLVFFLVCTFIDYHPHKDPFNFGKLRILLLTACLPLFFYTRNHAGNFIALFAAYQFGSWVSHHYQLYGTWDIIVTPATIAVAIYLTSNLKEKTFAAALTWAATFQAVYGILQANGVYPLFKVLEKHGLFKPIGTAGQETLLGCFLIAALPAALWTKRYWQAALITICCIYTKSSMTYAGLGLVLFIYSVSLSRNPKVFALKAVFVSAAILGSILLYLYFYHYWTWFYWLMDPNGRPFVWGKAWEAFLVNPIFGGGPGYWAGRYQPENNIFLNGLRPKSVHNEYLELAVEYGLIGVALLLGAMRTFIAKFRLSWHHITCVAIFFNALANFPVHQVATALIFMVAWVYSIRGEAND